MNVHFSGTAKRIVASIAAVAALGSMAACGSNGASNGGSDDELTVSYWDDEQDSIKEFIKQNPDIKVKEIRVPGDDYNTKLNQMIVGNTAPDVMLVQEADYVRFAQNGVLEKLDDQLSDLGIDKDDFQPAVKGITNQVDDTTVFRRASQPRSCITTRTCLTPPAWSIRPMIGHGTTTPQPPRS